MRKNAVGTAPRIPKRITLPESTRQARLECAAQVLGSVLQGVVLDVGCDKRHLKQLVGDEVQYMGVDLWGSPDVLVNLEQGLPFPDCSCDAVVCFDVLEHLENFHAVFDELCRITRHYVVIGLPNVASLKYRLNFLLRGRLPGGKYRLPVRTPRDRHRWLFSLDEARDLVLIRGRGQGMRIIGDAMIYVEPKTMPGTLYYLLGQALHDRHAELIAFSWWAVLQKE